MRRSTWLLVAVTVVVLLAASPGALRDAWARGGFYLFSWEFVQDLPRRLTGPGRLRFLIQPAVAIVLGLRAGAADRRAGRPPFLMAMTARGAQRATVAREAVGDVANLVLMGILIDTAAQWLILGQAYPAPALIVGPVLIALPYATARGLANRVGRSA